jgi:hypothetical protein
VLSVAPVPRIARGTEGFSLIELCALFLSNANSKLFPCLLAFVKILSELSIIVGWTRLFFGVYLTIT